MAPKGLLALSAAPKSPHRAVVSPFVQLFCVEGLGSTGWYFKTAELSFKIYSGEDKFTSKETISRGLENVNIFGKSCVKLLI